MMVAISAASASSKPGLIFATSSGSGKMRGGSVLLTEGSDTWKRRCRASVPFSRSVRNTKYELIASRAKPSRQPGSPKRTRATPSLTLNCQLSEASRGLSRSTPFSGLGRRTVLRVRLARQNLIVDTADPVPARADLAVRNGGEGAAERRSEGSEDLLHGVERDAADQK